MTDRQGTEPSVHPAADVWPMLGEADLRQLAEDIAENGLQHPIVLDGEGRILDGRNRYAACRIAGVDPVFETFEGNAVRRVLSENSRRRHLTPGQRAMCEALTLVADGKRQNGRWQYGAITNSGDPPNSTATWVRSLSQAGLIIDHLDAATARSVAAGDVALDAAYQQAKAAAEHAKRKAELPPDLAALVDADTVTLDDALRRNALPAAYQERVAAGGLSLDEAEQLSTQDATEHAAALRRSVDAIRAFLHGYHAAATLAINPKREEILADLDDTDRERMLTIEKEITWPTATI